MRSVQLAALLAAGFSSTRAAIPVNWGYSYTPVGVPVAQPATSILQGKDPRALAAGSYHTLVLCRDGTIVGWGDDAQGQLGDNQPGDTLSPPVAVNTTPGLSALATKTVTAIAAGANHSLALCSDGTVAAWGLNLYGQLGDTTTIDRTSPVSVVAQSGSSSLAGKTVVAIAAGDFHTIALCSDGMVSAWGYNYSGQLGDFTTVDSATPVAVNTTPDLSALAGKKVAAISAGADHCLALCSDGTLVAWGSNWNGNLGNKTGVRTYSTVPIFVQTTEGSALAGKTVVAVSAGGTHSLALCRDGTIVAWGGNSRGQLGNNSNVDSVVPVLVDATPGRSALAGKTVVTIAAGYYYSLALCSDGTVVAWGANDDGILGNGTQNDSSVPVATLSSGDYSVFTNRKAIAIAAGFYHSAALAAATAAISVSPPSSGTYRAGSVLSFAVNYPDFITVKTSGGTPRLVLTVGASTRYANYASGSGGSSLAFSYTVQDGDQDSDGIALATSTIDLNGGLMSDSLGYAADAALPTANTSGIKIDTASTPSAGGSAASGGGGGGGAPSLWFGAALLAAVCARRGRRKLLTVLPSP